LFPNPANSYFKIENKLPVECIEIYNMLGSRSLGLGPYHPGSHNIPVEKLQAGIYSFKVRFENEEIVSGKIVIK
jgi:hypothetical protein